MEYTFIMENMLCKTEWRSDQLPNKYLCIKAEFQKITFFKTDTLLYERKLEFPSHKISLY